MDGIGQARRALEAMRLGVVSTGVSAVCTVGREGEQAWIEGGLGRAAVGGAVGALMGDYGVGKSHLLEWVRQRALDEGFVVASAELGGQDVTASHPRRVYRALMRGLRYPGMSGGEGLWPLLERAARSPGALSLFRADEVPAGGAEELAQGGHLFLSPALRAAQGLAGRCDVDGARRGLLDWIEGRSVAPGGAVEGSLASVGVRPGKLYRLQDHRPWARIYAYLLSGLGAMAQAAGWRGLVVTLDEAELYWLLSSQDRVHALRFFKAMTLAAVGDVEAVLPFDAEELEVGGAGVLREVPARFGDGGLGVWLAMTPGRAGLRALSASVPGSCVRELGGLDREACARLARRVASLYLEAHPGSLPEGVVEPLTRLTLGVIGAGLVTRPREAIKFVVEFLDVARLRPSRVGAMVGELQAAVAR